MYLQSQPSYAYCHFLPLLSSTGHEDIRLQLLPVAMPLTSYLCRLLLLLLYSSKSCLGSHFHDCLSGNTCGGLEFSYPFGKNDSGCGDPEFQFRCDNVSGYHLLNISGQQYRIMEPSFLANDSNNDRIAIVNDNLWKGICNFSSNYSHLWRSGFPFHMAVGYTNLTLWRQCNESINGEKFQKWRLCGDDWYYFPTPDSGTRFCQINLLLPIQEFLIKRNGSLQINQTFRRQALQIKRYVDTNRAQGCAACSMSNGSCGYDLSERTRFLCYCPDGTSHPDMCPGNVTGTRNTGGRNRSAIIIGCSIGGFVLTGIAVLVLAYYVKRRKATPPRSSISKVEKFLRDYASEMPIRYSQSQLKKMTNNFAEKLGEGGFGVVYKGKLGNGSVVAVKILGRRRHSETQFMNEVATIGRVYHINLVRLLGYCFESLTSALVYEYMVNGSLEKFIFARNETGEVLRWEQLYAIALGAARGIAYLHEDCDKRIIHFDIKPHNILLDHDFTPKVSDFGLAKLCGKEVDHISLTGWRGTPGYVAPEVCDRDLGPVTDKSDVYSFGMFLLEMVGGRKNFDWKVSRSSQFYFPEWAFKLLESGELQLGMRLKIGRGGGEMGAENEASARKLTKIGLWCIQYDYKDRPCMSRVVQMLEGNGDDVTDPPFPLNSSAEPENHLVSSTEISY